MALGVLMVQAKGWGFGSMAVWGNSSGGGAGKEETDMSGRVRDQPEDVGRGERGEKPRTT